MQQKGAGMPIAAVIFDMDGVIMDSEEYWWEERSALAQQYGAEWLPDDQRHTMGTNTHEWSLYMKQRMGLDMSPEEIGDLMVSRVNARVSAHLPVLPGAVEAARIAASAYPVALASGSATPIINEVLRVTGLDQVFQVVVGGDSVTRGKPDPEIYLLAAAQLGVDPALCLGIEDSVNGLRALKAAGMYAIAVPSHNFPPPDDVLAMADARVASLTEFSLDLIRQIEAKA